MGQELLTEACKPGHLRIVDRQEERRLQQRQRAHVGRPGDGGDGGHHAAIGVPHEVRATVEQREQIVRVNLKVLTIITGWWAGRIPAAVGKGQRPPLAQMPEARPRRIRTGATVHEQNLGAGAIPDDCDGCGD